MSEQQMAKKIKDLEQRIEDLEKELQCATGRILPVDVGAARLRPALDTSLPDLGEWIGKCVVGDWQMVGMVGTEESTP